MAFASAGGAVAGDYVPPPPQALAGELFDEGQYAASAIEYRRLALRAEEPADAATWLWMAARAYAQPLDVRSNRLALDLLDAAEDAAPPGDSAHALPIAVLRAELSLRLHEPAVARYYFQSIPGAIPAGAEPAAAGAWREYAARGAAAAALGTGDLSGARAAAADYADVLGAVDAYAAATRKRPWLGGVLGMVPGMGYAYSGEWGNAVRSLLLNGLFGWAMAETAEDDEWAVFAVCTFFEITWYSGSIYGGIDAANRWNAREDAEAARAVRGGAGMPDPAMARLPILELEFK
ncbi:MAG: hypothetical protein IK066_05570 [Kiritimatiellae bacterium]|nr:hypothetical protein [Kiritimatiellia bacterium]